MTRRIKILVGVVVLVAVGLAGTAIAQATSSHEPEQQQARIAHPETALHKKVRSAKGAATKESHSPASLAQPQGAEDDTAAGLDQQGADEPEASDDDGVQEAQDDDSVANDQQADDQGEQEHATGDDHDDDPAQAGDEDDDESADSADDDDHEDDD